MSADMVLMSEAELKRRLANRVPGWGLALYAIVIAVTFIIVSARLERLGDRIEELEEAKDSATPVLEGES